MAQKPFVTPRDRRHRLKTWPKPYAAVIAGYKTFEWRRDDRDYKSGDQITLEEWVPNCSGDQGGTYTGQSITGRIGYVLRGPEFGVPVGWVVFSLVHMPKARKPRKSGGRVRMGNSLSDSQRYRARPARVSSVTRGGLPSLGKRK